VQRNIPQGYLQMTRLKRMDYWNWCRSFIDFNRECPFGCVYCKTQRTSDYRGLYFTRGLPEAKETIGIGLLSDAYTGIERQDRAVSDVLDFLFQEGFSVHIMTKSDAVVNDLEVLQKLSRKDRVRVTFTILTLRDSLTRQLEGSAPSAVRRLDALSALRRVGVPAGVSISPIIPGINDGRQALEELIGECKKKDARWVVFSGFDMVSSFQKSPLWNRASALHSDGERLKRHYRNLREFLIGTLVREGLPIRIPRAPLEIYRRRHLTQVVSEHLFNISYFFELRENTIGMLRYRRAAYEIENLDLPLKSIASSKKLGYIKGVNPAIEKVIEEVLYTGGSTLHSELQESLVSARRGNVRTAGKVHAGT
jgi:DNA repair photolyase